MKNIFVACLLLVLCQCDKEAVIDEGTPQCILDEIEVFKSSQVDCELEPGANVTSYRFQGEVVYAFDMGVCVSDGSTMILDKDCEEICVLGTIVGITDCKGAPFSNAEKLSVLWEE